MFFDERHSKPPPGKYLWQELFKSLQSFIFYPPPPFQRVRLKLVSRIFQSPSLIITHNDKLVSTCHYDSTISETMIFSLFISNYNNMRYGRQSTINYTNAVQSFSNMSSWSKLWNFSNCYSPLIHQMITLKKLLKMPIVLSRKFFFLKIFVFLKVLYFPLPLFSAIAGKDDRR